MTWRDDHLPGTPCWVDTLQPDPRQAIDFYGRLLGWSADDGSRHGVVEDYHALFMGGRRVAGVARAPSGTPAMWRTCIRVEDITSTLAAAEAGGGKRLTDPVDARGSGRVAMLTDPTGVAFGLWEAGTAKGAELVGEPGTWQMSALHSTDLDAAAEFYGGLFGWALEESDGPVRPWRLGDEVVAVATATDGDTVPAHWAVNFAVDDVDGVAERARSLGGGALMAPFDTPGFRNAVLLDQAGGVFAVSAPGRAASGR